MSKIYQMEIQESGTPTYQGTFDYAWCLIRCSEKSKIHLGISMLEQLVRQGPADRQRDYLFYLAVARGRLKEWDASLQIVNDLLTREPQNVQYQDLKRALEQRLKRDGLVGLGLLAGAGGLVLAGVGIAMALAKK